MARVIGTKRPSPDGDDSDQEDAQRRVRVKKERQDASGSSSHVNQPPADTQESNMSSEVDEDDEDDEEDMEEDEQDTMLENINEADAQELWEVSNARKAKYAGVIRDAGVIKSVTLTDFMCHRHLTAEFGEKMNFLVGHNGSGKSAILTAIAIAFGGKAAQTGRGSGMRDLVMKGADKAVISITLENRGSGAFEPHLYNPYLVIERTINKTGAASYKFRATKDGKVISDKRDTLVRIMDLFGLYIDSPLTILTQDAARSFLQSSDPKSLYKFFLNGTMLQSLSEAYDSIGQQISVFKNLKTAEENSVPELQEAWDRLQRQKKEMELVLNKRKDVDDLIAELAWSYVKQGEKEQTRAVEDAEKAEARLSEGQTRQEAEKAKIETIEGQLKDLEKTMNDFNANEAPVKAKREIQRRKVAEAQKVIAEMSGDISQCEVAIGQHAYQVADFEAKIQKKEQASQGNDPEVTRLRDLIQKHQTLTANLRRQRPKIEQTITDAEAALVVAEAAANSATDTKLEASKHETDQAKKIENLKAQTGNRLNAFGNRIDLVMREIDKARWTAARPIGPLGMSVSLNDPRYKDTFHKQMGQTLCQFAVRNDQDRKTMMDILKRCQRQGYSPGNSNRAGPSVIQYSGDRFDISSGDLSHINDTILSKLEITDVDVRNILVNAHSIERTFVWPQIRGSNGVTFRVRELFHQGIRQCNFVTADGFNARGNNGRDSSGPLGSYDGNQLLTKDVAQDIEDCRKEHGLMIQRRDEATNALRAADADLQKCKAALSAARRELDKVNGGIRMSEEKERKFADELAEKEVVDNGADLVGLRNDAEARKRGDEHQLAILKEELEGHKKAEQEARNLQKEIEAELEALAPMRNDTIEATTKLAQQRSQATNNVSWWKTKLVGMESSCVQARNVVRLKQDQLGDWLLQANAMTHNRRVETNRQPPEIERASKAAQEACARAEKQTGISSEELTRRLSIADANLRATKTRIRDMARLERVLEIALRNRQRYWTAERSRAAVSANSSFIVSMAKRALEAQIRFDHNNGSMFIRVTESGSQSQVNSDGETIVGPRQYKTPKTMSGGERSFTTVSLLLAMWDLSSSPMRCLDEWDVFLDPANRSVAAQMLLQGAAQSAETQFILITPQSMGGIDVHGPGNKVIRLADPHRNQRTLDFQAQPQE